MFVVSLTYDTYTPEDIEAGEASDSGYEYEDQPMTLREVVRALDRGGPWEAAQASDDLLRLYTSDSDENYRTGEHTNRAIHIRGSVRALRRLWAYLSAKGYK